MSERKDSSRDDPYPGASDESGPEEWDRGYRHHWFKRWERPFGSPKEPYRPEHDTRAERPWLTRLANYLRGPRGSYG